MTAQLSRERLEEIKEFGLAKIIKPISDDEILALVDIALAGMGSEQVAWQYKEYVYVRGLGNLWREKLDCEFPGSECETLKDIVPLYAAPPAPVAVPDEVLNRLEHEATHVTAWHHMDEHSCKVNRRDLLTLVNACRAAMQAEPVTAATVPDGWKIVPLIAFPPQWAAGQKAFNSAGINKVDAVYKAMVESAPAAPEQEV